MWSQGIGAEIMGRRKSGPQVGDWPDDGWRGWWGDEPPFQTPVFVMSHYPHQRSTFPTGRASGSWTGRLTRCFAWPRRLRVVAMSASAEDLRPRQFLQADLVDFMHLVIVPITLGRGVSLWEGSSGLEDRFTVESVTSPSGLTHQLPPKRDKTSMSPSTRRRTPGTGIAWLHEPTGRAALTAEASPAPGGQSPAVIPVMIAVIAAALAAARTPQLRRRGLRMARMGFPYPGPFAGPDSRLRADRLLSPRRGPVTAG